MKKTRHQVRQHNHRAIDTYENPFIPFCRNCGRILHSEKSIERGYGPACGLYFAEKWISGHPNTIGEGAKKLYTREQIKEALLAWVVARKVKRDKEANTN